MNFFEESAMEKLGMNLFGNENQSYYEILDIQPGATIAEIRQAYFRTKAAYGRDSAALYSLFDDQQTKQLLEKIEEAYLVLSNEEKRREYDYAHGFDSKNSVKSHSNETSFVTYSQSAETTLPDEPQERPIVHIIRRNSLVKAYSIDPVMEEAIQNENNFRGSFLKNVREYKQISLDELAEYTKISKNYLTAIEEENRSQLPAAAYVRGFIVQIAKALRMDPERVAQGYMQLFKAPASK